MREGEEERWMRREAEGGWRWKQIADYVAVRGMVTVPTGVAEAKAACASVASAGAGAKCTTNLSSFGAPACEHSNQISFQKF